MQANIENRLTIISQKSQLITDVLSREAAAEPNISKSPRISEQIIQAILLLCGALSVITTVLIVYSLANQAIGFFQSEAWLPARILKVNTSVAAVTLPTSIEASSTEIILIGDEGQLERISYSENQYIRIGSEIMQVMSVGQRAVTVQRGVDGTVASAHEAGAQIEALASNPIRLGEELNASDTQISIASAGSLPFTVGQIVRIHNETMQIMEIAADGTSITVSRGYDGTEAAAHSLDEPLQIAKQPTLGEFLTSIRWQPQIGDFGVLPLVTATLTTTVIALLVAVPLGLGAAIYLSEYASARNRAVLKPILEVLAGVPTVVYGFFAITFMTPLLRAIFGSDVVQIYNTSSAGIVMGIMIIPTISSISEDALSAVPRSLREASYGLGATRLETILRVIVPAALSGIIAAFILGMSRAVGETMIVAIAAGAGPKLTFNPFESAETMTGHIARISGGDLSYGSIDYNSIFAIGLTLFAITMLLNFISGYISRRFREVYQ